jgi:hypothetical protein
MRGSGGLRLPPLVPGGEPVDAIEEILIGLLGTLIGAAVAWHVGRRQTRLETVFSMHHEFNAPDMTHSRNLAGKTVRRHSSESFDEMRTNLAPEETQHIWNVMYFYQRLWLAIKYRSIHRRFVADMFGENFYWWYLKSYQDQLVPLDWQAGRHIDALMKWIEKNSDPRERVKWRRRVYEMRDPGTFGTLEDGHA